VNRFGKPVYHREDDRFPLDLGQPFHEVNCNVSPHHRRDIQGLQETRRVELFRFVALAHMTFPDEVMHYGAGAGNMEIDV
jgi:hypothetical protein